MIENVEKKKSSSKKYLLWILGIIIIIGIIALIVYNTNKKKEDYIQESKLPFVSVCTPTYNRKKFFPALIECFKKQTYPKSRMEWVIVDDGTDSVESLVKNVEGVKYIRPTGEKMKLGAKRNYMHKFSKGDIIVYMDDDDYYPPERVEEAVKKINRESFRISCG